MLPGVLSLAPCVTVRSERQHDAFPAILGCSANPSSSKSCLPAVLIISSPRFTRACSRWQLHAVISGTESPPRGSPNHPREPCVDGRWSRRANISKSFRWIKTRRPMRRMGIRFPLIKFWSVRGLTPRMQADSLRLKRSRSEWSGWKSGLRDGFEADSNRPTAVSLGKKNSKRFSPTLGSARRANQLLCATAVDPTSSSRAITFCTLSLHSQECRYLLNHH
jgi:hypothetical protein